MNYKKYQSLIKDIKLMVLLDRTLPYIFRKYIRITLFYILVIFFIIYNFFRYTDFANEIIDKKTQFLFFGLFLIIFSFWLSFYLIEAMYVEVRNKFKKTSYPLARVIFEIEKDIVLDFLCSPVGNQIRRRLGIDREQWSSYKNVHVPIDPNIIDFSNLKEGDNLRSYVALLSPHLNSFFNFLKNEGYSMDQWYGAVYMCEAYYKYEWKERLLWRSERLKRLSSLGRLMTTGSSSLITKNTRKIKRKNLDVDQLLAYQEYIEQCETKLKENNKLILISADHSIAEDVLSYFNYASEVGYTISNFENNKVRFLDLSEKLIKFKDQKELLSFLDKFFNELSNNKNVICAITHFAGFMEEIRNRNWRIENQIIEILKSCRTPIIAVASASTYRRTLETNLDLRKIFGFLEILPLTKESIDKWLIEYAFLNEKKYNCIITYPAIEAIQKNAKRYYDNSIVIGKIFSLFDSVLALGYFAKPPFLLETDVLNYIRLQTGSSVDLDIKNKEDQLKYLKGVLQSKVIGQTQAIENVILTLDKVYEKNKESYRPLASFLFIGPTGVGKSETARTISEVFYGNSNLIKIDLASFQDQGSVINLFGNDIKTGILANLISERSFGVIVFDNFDKATTEVRNRCLDVIDSGSLNDYKNGEISLHNFIIIAISSAGNDLIYKQRFEKQLSNVEVLAAVSKFGIFSEQVLEKFDGIGYFHTLEDVQLRRIAGLRLDDLKDRIFHDYKIKVSFDFNVVDYLINNGYDRTFGARSMNRLIDDKIYSFIQNQIKNKIVSSGDNIKVFLDSRNEIALIKEL